MTTIIFATIGDPKRYEEVEYFIQGKSPVRSRMSFLALKDLLPNPSDIKTVAIIGISTADIFGCECKDYSLCSTCISNKAGEIGVKVDEFIVPPNPYKNFKTKPEYYFTYVYYKALKILERENPTDVYLDITHGINYMIDLAKEALLLAVSAYAAMQGKNINFRVYNSDPIMMDANRKVLKGPYEIHEIEKRTITPLLGLKHITTQIISRDKNYFQILRRDGVIDDVKKIAKFANALDNGLFVYFADKSNEIQRIKDSLESKLTEVNMNIDNEIRIEFKPGSYALAHSLLYIALHFKPKGGNCLDIEALKEFAEKYADEVTKTIIQNEIDNTIEKNKDRIGKEKKLLAEIVKSGLEELLGKQKDVEKKGGNKRILYAHGGLPLAWTYVYEQDGKICVTYGDKINEVENNM